MKRHNLSIFFVNGFVFLTVAMLSGACTGDFDSLNTNHHAAQQIEASQFLTTMQIDVVPCSDVDANQYQRACNLTGDIYSGYMAGTGSWGTSNGINYDLYYNNGEWGNMLYRVAYTQVLPAWRKIKTSYDEDNFPEASWAITQVTKIMSMHRVADAYGPIPYLKFGQSMVAPYDSQQAVYVRFFEELNAAIAVLEEVASSSETPLAKVDLVYGGNYAKWLRLANSLKLRLAMRIVYADPDNAKKHAEEAIASGVVESNADNAQIQSVSGTMVYNPFEVCWDSYGDCRMGAAMDSFLNGYKDPRLTAYFQAAKTGQGHHGVMSGIANNSAKTWFLDKTSAPNIYKATPVEWLLAAEVAFLRAEGALRGWNMGGTTEFFYNQGVTLSFEQRAVSGAAAYLENATDVPARFEDVSNRGYGKAAVSTITIKWLASGGFEKNLEQIITQKWLAIYPNGQEAWAEFRRTGYPKLFPVNANKSGNTVDSDVQIRRLVFPQQEYNTNGNEVQKATALLQSESKKAVNGASGCDTGGTYLWWDKK